MAARDSVDPAGWMGEQVESASPDLLRAMVKTFAEEAWRTRALDTGPYTVVWLDALTVKAREGGRTVNVHALVAVRTHPAVLALGCWCSFASGRPTSSRTRSARPPGLRG